MKNTIRKSKKTALAVNVSVKDTEIFQNTIEVFKELLSDERTPDWIKDKIRSFVEETLRK